MVGGQKGQEMNWKAGDKDCGLDVGGHFSLLARELESESLESKLCWVWAGKLCAHKPGRAVCGVYSALDRVCSWGLFCMAVGSESQRP